MVERLFRVSTAKPEEPRNEAPAAKNPRGFSALTTV